MAKYLVTFRRNDNFGTEEYDGGTTLVDARKEARFFCDNLPSHVRVSICKVVGNVGRLETVEVVREGTFENAIRAY